MPQVGLDCHSYGVPVRDMQRAYVRGPGGSNAIEPMVTETPIRETLVEVPTFTDIIGRPIPVGELVTEDVNAGTGLVLSSNLVELKLVLPAAHAGPIDIALHFKPHG